MTDKTLGAYTRHDTPDTPECDRHIDHITALERHLRGRNRQIEQQEAALRGAHAMASLWKETALQLNTRAQGRKSYADFLLAERGRADKALVLMVNRLISRKRDLDGARALLTEAQEEATRQAVRADQAEYDRDNARRWLGETEALLDQAKQERDEARARADAAESRPLTPEDITDDMIQRAKTELEVRAGGDYYPETLEAVLAAALTEPPKRPDGAEEIEAVLREEWTFSDEDGGEEAFADLAQRLAARGFRVVGEERS